MKTLRILLAIITPCCLALCTTTQRDAITNRIISDGKVILDAQLTKAEK